jgi:4-amino-4-deoxy-L-arabinose transferase-like glycosyltransferase
LGSVTTDPTFTVMPLWLQYLIAAAAFVVVAPLMVWLAKRFGGRARGGLMMAGILLGFGEVVDPPSKHLIEAQEGEEKSSPENDEPLEP